MSMFKGQGANQALMDGPLLAQWLHDSCTKRKTKPTVLKPELKQNCLSRRDLSTRLRCFEREMMSRAAPKVALSREAAVNYHSMAALEINYGFEGLDETIDRMKERTNVSDETVVENAATAHSVVKLLADDRISADYFEVSQSLSGVHSERATNLEKLVWESFQRNTLKCGK